jgi:glycogen(starch) synthase
VDAERKVLLTADTVGGVWHYALQLAGSLSRTHRYRVALATMGAPLTRAQRGEVARLAGVTLHESRFRLEWMQDPWEDLERAGQWLLALEDRLRPDLVHLNQFAFGSLPFGAPKLLVAHSCVVSWWRAVRGEAPPPQWDRYRAVVRAGLAGADLVAAPTRDMLSSLAFNHGHRQAGLVLPNGRDPDLFPAAPKRPLIVSAGRLWDEAKNLRALEAVAPDVAWPIEVAGNTCAPGGSVRVSSGLTLLGELSGGDLARRFAAASICAHPVRYEPFGLAPLEAALAGCALVLGDLSSLRETWGSAALYVPPNDHRALRAALQRLIADPGLLHEMSRRAHEVALRHSGAGMARAYVAAYAWTRQAAARAGASLHTAVEEKQCAS